jgi:type VI secretion system protein ImpF
MPPTELTRVQRLPRDQPLKPSVLDRLIVRDDDGRPPSPGQLLREVQESVRGDLEDLLNTRPLWAAWPASLGELEDSLVNYGLPDFSGANLSAPQDHAKFCDKLRRCIESFEPRLQNVTVQKTSKGEPLNRILSFRIEATLRIFPIEDQQIVFDSTIEPISASFAVRRDR